MPADSIVRVISLSRRCLDFPKNLVRCLSSVRILSVFSVRYLSFRILSVSILTGVRILSGFPAGQGRDRDVRSVGVLVRSLDGIKRIIIQVKIFVAFNCSL